VMATRLRWSVGRLQLKQGNLLLKTACQKELYNKPVTDISFHISPQYFYNMMPSYISPMNLTK
jgi:hypothetical protein